MRGNAVTAAGLAVLGRRTAVALASEALSRRSAARVAAASAFAAASATVLRVSASRSVEVRPGFLAFAALAAAAPSLGNGGEARAEDTSGLAGLRRFLADPRAWRVSVRAFFLAAGCPLPDSAPPSPGSV